MEEILKALLAAEDNILVNIGIYAANYRVEDWRIGGEASLVLSYGDEIIIMSTDNPQEISDFLINKLTPN